MLKKFIEFTKLIVNTTEFMEKSRKNKKVFIRNRKVSFAMNILLIFACLKRSIQTGIDQFIIDMDTEFNTYSKQAFSKRRQCILPEAFQELYYANLYLYNALAMLMYGNNNKTPEKKDIETKYVYKINESQAVNKIRDNLIKAVMAESKIERNKLFMKVYKQLQKELVPVRPNRTYKRKRKHPGVKFPQNQKS